jgi:hypothetical protein
VFIRYFSKYAYHYVLRLPHLRVCKVYVWALVYTVGMRLEAAMEVCMKFIIIWYVMSRRPLERYQCFRGSYCLHLQGRTNYAGEWGFRYEERRKRNRAVSGLLVRGWTAQSPVSSHLLTMSVPHLLVKLMLLPWRWRQHIAQICWYFSTRICSWCYITEYRILYGNEPSSSRIIGWLLTSQGLSCMELVSRLFMPMRKNIFICWKFQTHIDDSFTLLCRWLQNVRL